MPSNYDQIDVTVIGETGAEIRLPNQVLKVFDATNLMDLPDVESDENGVVPAGELAVAPGTVVRFRVENYLGMAWHIAQRTT